MREASRRLSQSLFDAYESDWAAEEDLGAFVEVSMITSDGIKRQQLQLYHCTFLFYKYNSSKDALPGDQNPLLLPLFIHI